MPKTTTEWTQFTKRTDQPKLGWIMKLFKLAGIPIRRQGRSFHAPITVIPVEHEEVAWSLLGPIDILEDDDLIFRTDPTEADLKRIRAGKF